MPRLRPPQRPSPPDPSPAARRRRGGALLRRLLLRPLAATLLLLVVALLAPAPGHAQTVTTEVEIWSATVTVQEDTEDQCGIGPREIHYCGDSLGGIDHKGGDVGSIEPKTFVYGGAVFRIIYFNIQELEWLKGGNKGDILGTGSYILYVNSHPQPFESHETGGGVAELRRWTNVDDLTPGQTLSLRLVEVFESGLTLALPDGSAAALTPEFSAAVTSYAAEAPHSAEHVTVAASGTSVLISPEDADPAAAGHQVALAPGANAVTAAVTMGEGAAATTTTYSVNVTRAATDVCERTPEVRDAILALVPDVTDCHDLTPAHLAAITGTLDLQELETGELKAQDLKGLTGVTQLYMSSNSGGLSLPPGIFDDLVALEQFYSSDTPIGTLPPGVFDNLTALTRLNWTGTELSTLRPGVFDNLTALTHLSLGRMHLSTLPPGVFDNLTALTSLLLENGRLTALPPGVFEKLTALTELDLHGHPGSAGFLPAAEAGDAQTPPPGARVVLDGRTSADSGPWKSNVDWAWTQVDVRGEVVDPPTVTLTGADTATPAFTAPATAGPLHFRLTVTGRGGDHTASDTVTVTVASSTAQMDASLASLAVTHAGAAVALTPAFSPGTDRYRARPANAAARVTVAAAAGNAAATVALLDLYGAPLGDADPATADSFEVDLTEGGNIVRAQVTAADGATTRTYVLNLARNTLPTGAERTVTVAEDTQYTFGVADFGFVDRDAGDALASVTVATLPGAGRLALGGAAVGAGDAVAAHDLARLTFTPAPDGHGDPYATFTFRVSDGIDESAAHTMTIVVTPLNEAATGAPAITGPSAHTAMVGETLSAGPGSVDDADGRTMADNGDAGHAYTWQWLRVGTDGTSSPTPIEDATSSTYTVAPADRTKRLRVVVSFTDDAGNAETRTSEAYPRNATVIAGRPGAPRSFAASPGDGRAVLSWQAPQHGGGLSVSYRVRHAAGLSVPAGTGWTDVGNVLTRTETGLDNGAAYAFEVQAMSGAGGSAAATAQATPMAGACAAPYFGERRNFWTGTVTVGAIPAGSLTPDYGFGSGAGSLLPDATFSIGAGSHTIEALTAGNDGALELTLASALPATEQAALRLHVCDEAYDLGSASHTGATYAWAGSLDWSGYSIRTVYLSLPDNSATGAPAITGTARSGEVLTADLSAIMDADGRTGVDFTYKWVRVDADGASGETEITGATTATYTLTDADIGKRLKVKVSFTDDLGDMEMRTSAAYPASGTVTDAVAATVTEVRVSSTPKLMAPGSTSPDTYGAGESIEFTVTFSAGVTVTGDPQFGFALGNPGQTMELERLADYDADASTAAALVFAYTVQATDEDSDGIAAGDQSQTFKLDAGARIYTISNGVDAVRTHDALDIRTSHKVDGSRTDNTAPTAANKTVTAIAGTAYAFTTDDFGFADDDTGDMLESVTIESLPVMGTLALGGTVVTLNQAATRTQLDAGDLTFTPAPGASGAGYASFTFKVNDGKVDSAGAYTMTIDVADAPAPVCAASSFGDRREIWTGTVTVGPFDTLGPVTDYGFDSGSSIGSLLPSRHVCHRFEQLHNRRPLCIGRNDSGKPRFVLARRSRIDGDGKGRAAAACLR